MVIIDGIETDNIIYWCVQKWVISPQDGNFYMDNDDYPTDLGWAIFANPYGYDKIGVLKKK